MNFSMGYGVEELSREIIERWGKAEPALSEEAGLLHSQVQYLGNICKSNALLGVEVLEFLESTLGRKDVVSELENAIAISFLSKLELESLDWFDQGIAPRVYRVVEVQHERDVDDA